MSRLYEIKQNYKKFEKKSDKFLLSLFLRKLIKNGYYSKAKKLIVSVFILLKSKEKINSYLFFLVALYNISPKVKIITEINPKTNKLYFKKEVLTPIKSILLGLNILVKNFPKNKEKTTKDKLCNEIILSFYKKSLSIKKKYELEKFVMKKTVKDFGYKKKISFVNFNNIKYGEREI